MQKKTLKISNDVQINFITEKKGWIIRRIVDELIPICSSYRIIDGHGIFLYRNFLRILKRKKILINYFATYTWFDKKFIGSAINICLLTHLDEKNVEAIDRWKFAVKNADFLVAISNFSYQQALKYGCKKDKIKIIPYGIDHDIYRPTCNLLLVGNAHERKGKTLVNKIVSSTELDKSIQIRANSIKWDVESFPKALNNLPFLYDWCDALLVPSSIEGGHTPTLEALAKGKPVITTKTGWSFYELENIEFRIDNIENAISVLNNFAQQTLKQKSKYANKVIDFTWDEWRNQNYLLMIALLEKQNKSKS